MYEFGGLIRGVWVQTQGARRYVSPLQFISGMGHGTYQRPGGLSTTSGFQNEKRKFSGFASAQHQRAEIENLKWKLSFYLDVIGRVAPPVRKTFVSQSHVSNGKFGWFCLPWRLAPNEIPPLLIKTPNIKWTLCSV